MTSLIIPKLDAELMTRLRKRAEQNGRTIEQEASVILFEALVPEEPVPRMLGKIIRVRFI
jgi:plasmid stability protein